MSLAVLDLVADRIDEYVSGPCYLRNPSWSPDGEEIAYMVAVSGAPSTQEVEGNGTYILDVASGEVRRLTAPERFDLRAEWLADGSGLVVGRFWCSQCDATAYEAVYVPLDGGAERVLARADTLIRHFGGFAPDARRYLYAADALRVGTLGGGSVALAAPEVATGYIHLAWHPSGESVAYVRTPDGMTRRYSLDMETGGVELTQALAIGRDRLSPDGQLVSFTETGEGSRGDQLWVSAADGTGERLLAGEEGDIYSPVWSWDSRRFIYQVNSLSGAQREVTVKVADVESGETRELPEVGTSAGAAWSWDSTRLAATGRRDELLIFEDGSWQSSSPASGEDAALRLGNLAWSPNGETLAGVVSDGPQTTHVAVVDLESGELRRLTGATPAEFQPAWSPDGTRIAFTRGSGDPPAYSFLGVYTTSLDTSQERELARFETLSRSFGFRLAWSPDSRRLAVFVPTGAEPGIYVVGADGTGATRVVETSVRWYGDITWSSDGQKLLFSSFAPGL
jgi:Tol biopolymer transport system component